MQSHDKVQACSMLACSVTRNHGEGLYRCCVVSMHEYRFDVQTETGLGPTGTPAPQPRP